MKTNQGKNGHDLARTSRRTFLSRAAAFAAITIPSYAYGNDVEGNDLVVEETSIQIANWPRSTPPLKVGFMSDFHCENEAALTRTSKALQIMLHQRPDIILLGGDFVTHSVTLRLPEIAEIFKALSPLRGRVFAVLGNHDYWSGSPDKIASHLRGIGIDVLRNESRELPNAPGVWLVGLDDVLVNKNDVSTAVHNVPPEACKLLLVHEPDYADQAPAGFALQLSGHSHAGQVRVFGMPLIVPVMGRHYPQGLQSAKNHPVYTTRGVGMVHPEVRFDCPPEITILNLHCA